MFKLRIAKVSTVALSILLGGFFSAHAQSDVTQPGDPIIASSANSPGSEGVANAIDGKPTKYLNFDSGTNAPAGFIVSPSVGVTLVTGMTMESANDAADRDPKKVTLEGSNDDTVTDFKSGNWAPITTIDNIPAWANRFETKSFSFTNATPYKHYRWTVLDTQGPSTCCLQIAEVELLGTILPGDVTQPGDPIIASSANSPGSEGVANAIDGKPTKYLNFDSGTNAPAGFVVSPAIGVTIVKGLSMQSANDAADRDPKKVTLEGSNDPTVTGFASGTWELITTLDNIPPYPARFQTQYFLFDNTKPYRHYRWTVLETQGPSTCCLQIAEVEFLGTQLPPDVTQPGDAVIASSANSPGSEGVANIIDNKPTKYLNFDAGTNAPAGFIVTPSVGRTLVTGMTMQSANDAADRDPKKVTLEGSNDDTVTTFASGNWELITTLADIVPFPNRFETKTFVFDNAKGYKHYRWTVVETQGPSTCCFQMAEVELLGVGIQDVTVPGDPVIASSSNSPGSEGVANAIDGKPTKYLNFDSGTNAPAGFIVSPSVGSTTIIGLSMQSANDAADRDPKDVTIEGSNASDLTDTNSVTWELIVKLDDIPAFPNRFQTQDFYFPNKKAYKHYRWTVLETQGPSTCCLQIAEVEFLAPTSGADCSKARFVTQPVDTPALEGTSATFVTVVNGPWPLQWLLNGSPIPGAIKSTYTTDPLTVTNATNVYSVKIVGCETSVEVKAVLFKPSATKSIAVSFIGGGANGAPTSMLTNDITGVQAQAFWNNAAAGSGDLPDPAADPVVPLVDSDNQPATVSFTWATSGTWGAGTGDATATQRMLNGLVGGNAPGTVGTLTFNNVPAGSHAVLVYAVGPPLQFQNVRFTIGSTTYHLRTMNSDEYNAAPGFYRGVSTDPTKPTVANFVAFENVQPVNGSINLDVETLTPGFDRQTGINGIQLVLNAQPLGTPPVITVDPQPTVVADGGTAALSVTATGQNLTYQWRKDGRNLPNGGNISGATTSTLSIGTFSDADQAAYSVVVLNPAGSAVSKNASVRLSKFDINEALVAYFNLDQTSGTVAANSASGGKPGNVTGVATWVKGQITNAFSFDGATYILVDDYTKAKKQIAGSAWVNVPAGGAADVAIMRNARGALTVSGGATRTVGQFEMGLVLDANDNTLKPMAAVGIGPNVARATGTAAFPTASWHHIAFSADGAQLRLYVDGKQVAVTDYLADINPPDVPYISIGANLNLADPADPTSALGPDSATPNYMSGPIDDLAVWTRALTADEVSKIFAAGSQGQPLTTVQITQQPPPVGLEFNDPVLQGSTFKISWIGTGTLQESSTVNGTYTDVPAAEVSNNSYSADVKTEGPAKFYRLKQ